MKDAFRTARLWSGLILMVYVTTHLLNHALGLFSIAAMEAGAAIFLAIWRNLAGTIVLYGALLAHILLTLWSLYHRRSLRMHSWELGQMLLGFMIPPLLIAHIIGTRGVYEFIGATDSYTRMILLYSHLNRGLGVQQILLLVIAWVHGCMGIHYWLRLRPVYGAIRQYLFATALLVPAFSIFGFIQAGHEIDVLLREPGWLRDTKAALGLNNRETIAFLNSQVDIWRTGLGALLLITLAARLIRPWLVRRKGLVRLIYPDARTVDVAQGISVLEASRIAGIPHASVCGGRGRCSTCRVRIGESATKLPEASGDERKVLARVSAPPNVRLACQLRPGPGRFEILPLLPPTATARDAFQRPAYVQGREDEIAVLFADLRAFTKFSEKMLPFDVVFILNRYFSAMGSAVEDAGGHIDKFIGDGVMALFGVGADPQTAARQAISAARAMGEKLTELNASLKNELSDQLRMGIGIHIGPAIVGEMGYGETTNLTAIGDTVNTASRLEALTKRFKAEVVISEAVAKQAGLDLSDLPSHEITVRGREEVMTVKVAKLTGQLPATGVRAERRREASKETKQKAKA